jgi:hypothetical protein
MTFDDAAHEFTESLVPVGAEAMWNLFREASPSYVAPWSEQDGSTRARFTAALVCGLEAMAAHAGEEL